MYYKRIKGRQSYTLLQVNMMKNSTQKSGRIIVSLDRNINDVIAAIYLMTIVKIVFKAAFYSGIQ